jgi:hypothetical protein
MGPWSRPSWLGALFALCSAGCADELDLGEYRCRTVSCSGGTITLLGEVTGTSARADQRLESRWSVPWQTSMYVQAHGSVWAAEASGDALLVRELDADGVLHEPLRVVGPEPASPTRTVSLLGMTSDGRGPVISVAWQDRRNPNVPCDDALNFPTVRCTVQRQALLFDTADIVNPRRVELCQRVTEYCSLGPIMRSGDGSRLLIREGARVEQRSLDGQLLVEDRFPSLFSPGPIGAAIDARRWLLFGFENTASSTPGAHAGLLFVDEAGETSMQWMSIDTSWRGGVLTGPTAGEAIVIVTPNADIAVLRLAGSELRQQQVLLRQEYADLELDAYAADSVGNAYVATATGDRSATENDMLKPLLCRFPPQGEGHCFVLPERARSMSSIAPNVVLVQGASSLSRYDVP